MSKKRKSLHIRIDEEDAELIKALAKKEGVSVNDLMVRCIRFYLEKDKNDFETDTYVSHSVNRILANQKQVMDILEMLSNNMEQNNRQLWGLFGGEGARILGDITDL
ncbi:ribbon-helix-helix protein, CopG family [Ligilactobacillus faecis]|uniref:Ribbon-helix-helix protein, CopG family n=1 Tax=Ligilactobacillus faecis TaxID=762833 RepID=A0ABV4DMS1_9LACO